MLLHLWALYLLLGVTSGAPPQPLHEDTYKDPAVSHFVHVPGTKKLFADVRKQHSPSIVYPENFNRNLKQQTNTLFLPHELKDKATTLDYWYVEGPSGLRQYFRGPDIKGNRKYADSTEEFGFKYPASPWNDVSGDKETTNLSPTHQTIWRNQFNSFSPSKDTAETETTPGYSYPEVVNRHLQGEKWDITPPNAFLMYVPEGIVVPDIQPITQRDLYFDLLNYDTEKNNQLSTLEHKSFVKGKTAMVAYRPVGVMTSDGFLPLLSFSKVLPQLTITPNITTTEFRKADRSNDLYVPGSRVISDVYSTHRSRRSTRSRISHADLDEFIKEIDKVTSENRQHVDDVQSSRTPAKKQKTILGRIRDYLPSFGRKKHTRRSVHMDQHAINHSKTNNGHKKKYLPRQKHHLASKLEQLNKPDNHHSVPTKKYNSYRTEKKQVRVARSVSDNILDKEPYNSLNKPVLFSVITNEVLPSIQTDDFSESVFSDIPNDQNQNNVKVSSTQHLTTQSLTEPYYYLNGNVPERQTQGYIGLRKISKLLVVKQNPNSLEDGNYLKLGKFIYVKPNNPGKMYTDLYKSNLGDKYMNELVDFIIHIVNRGVMAKGNSTVNIPDVDQEFEKTVLGIKVHGEFHGKNGWFKNLSSIYRDGDVTVTWPRDDTLAVQFSIALRTMEFGFDHYDATVAGINADGHITGVVVSNSMSASISMTIDSTNKCNISLDSFKVSKLGDIDFKITGLGELNWFANKITSWLSDHYKNDVADKVQQKIITEVNSVLSHVKC